MSNEPTPVVFDEDNPEWTEADFARAKTGDEIPAHIRAAFGGAKRGRPVGYRKAEAKRQITLRLDSEVVDRWRATGPGWQSRMNEALRIALPPPG